MQENDEAGGEVTESGNGNRPADGRARARRSCDQLLIRTHTGA
jgi:hypothetical protein